MSRFILFVLVMTLQACMAASDSSPTPGLEETAGILERTKQIYRETKAKVLNVGSTMADFAGMYYEEHLKQTADSYIEWAKASASSLWSRLKDSVNSYRLT